MFKLIIKQYKMISTILITMYNYNNNKKVNVKKKCLTIFQTMKIILISNKTNSTSII